MKKNSSVSKKNVFLRAAAFVFAAVMLLSAVACSEETNNASSEENPYTDVKADELDQELKDFLIRFADWYEVEEGQKLEYDSRKAGDGQTNILRSIVGNAGCVDWNNYPVTQPREITNGKKLDPKKWSKESGGMYLVCDSKGAEWIATNIFHVTGKDLEAMREQGEQNKWFYLDGENYYTVMYGIGDPLTEYTFDSAKTDGTVYYVDFSGAFNNGEEITPKGSYRAEVQKKSIDGKDYWTLNKLEETTVSE